MPPISHTPEAIAKIAAARRSRPHKYPRTPELVRQITEMRAAGKSWNTIGRAMGVNPSTAKMIGDELGLPARVVTHAVARGATPLNDLIREMWTQGCSGEEIARQTGITKDAVIGRAHRMGLPGRPSPLVPAKVPQVRTSSSGAPYRPVIADGGTGAIPAGHPMTWALITAGTLLEGAPYR